MNDLYSFELDRKAKNYLPPVGSNSFFDLDTGTEQGQINLLCYRNTPGNERFDLAIESGVVYSGQEFGVYGNIYDNNKPYNDMVIKTGSQLIINGSFIISMGKVESHDNITVQDGCVLNLVKGGEFILYPDASLTLEKGSELNIENGHITVYGQVTVDITIARALLNNPNITWDTAAVVDVTGFDPADRPVTMREYEKYMRDVKLAIYASDRIQTVIGIMESRWQDGNYDDNYQAIQLKAYSGESILGDFKLSVLGLPDHHTPNTQFISSIKVDKGATLYVSDTGYDNEYVFPELYLGIKIGNTKIPGYCEVDGSLIVDGRDAKLTVDRGGYIVINEGGIITIRNKATLLCDHSDGITTLFINGTLVLETIELMKGFDDTNIEFGPNGKVVILNQYPDQNHVLYKVPISFRDTQLYQLFGDQLEHVEYHVQSNTGIEIGVYYDYYSRDLKQWFGNYRIEDAVHRGMMIWHDGGFIKLKSDLIWWVDDQCDLITISQIFKSVGSLGKERLKEVVNRLQYAGFESIRFVLEIGNRTKEITLNLTYPHMTKVRPNSADSSYWLETDRDGRGFVRGSIGPEQDEVIHPKAKQFDIVNFEGTINL